MDKILTEEWRDVKGYEGHYQVSNFGRVRSLDRTCKNSSSGTRKVSGKILKGGLDRNGYHQVLLYKNGKREMKPVHVFVGLHFLKPCPGVHGRYKGNYHIDHDDENTLNNSIDNLQWLIIEDNVSKSHKREGRTGARGEKSKWSKLRTEDVIKIRNDFRTYKEIAQDYNVTPEAIQAIIANKTWNHLPYPSFEKQKEFRSSNHAKGERMNRSKLSKEDIIKIRNDNRSNKEIAKDYGVTPQAIRAIKIRLVWKHI